jgi:hypothetical protein
VQTLRLELTEARNYFLHYKTFFVALRKRMNLGPPLSIKGVTAPVLIKHYIIERSEDWRQKSGYSQRLHCMDCHGYLHITAASPLGKEPKLFIG